MRKILLVAFLLLLAVNCFADVKSFLSKPDGTLISPTMSGANFTASGAIITLNGQILSFGSQSNISKIVISCPSGEAYVGNGSVSGSNGIVCASTMSALTLDIQNLSGLNWTGKAGQKLNFIIIY